MGAKSGHRLFQRGRGIGRGVVATGDAYLLQESPETYEVNFDPENRAIAPKVGTLPIFKLPSSSTSDIERNPLKVGLTEIAEDYPWSSARSHLIGVEDTVLADATWLDPSERTAYAEFVLAENEEMDETIRKATRTGRPVGSESFVDMLEFRLKQTLRPKKAGRPRKK
jgi:putative transposase